MTSAKGLLILDADDFQTHGDRKITHLTHTVKCKHSIVMFYTNECNQCSIIKPILHRFIGNPDIQICMVDVYDPDSISLIQLSQKTTTPLKHVPFIVFYINGVPFRKYDGQYTLDEFRGFVKNSIEEASKIQDPSSQIKEIPPYTTGIPNSAKVCHLTYQKAY